jgi:Lrp/AsnC family transcriptional regulator for asnA, asnC and gidA
MSNRRQTALVLGLNADYTPLCEFSRKEYAMLLDELDEKLISLLQTDGRASNIELAKKVGVSEGTIRRRFRNLIKDEVIKVVAIPDPAKLGRGTTALVGLQVEPSLVDPVAVELAEVPEVQYVSVTTGAYDIFIWVALASPEELSTFLRTRVGAIEGVRRTETFVNLSIRKNPAGPSVAGKR